MNPDLQENWQILLCFSAVFPEQPVWIPFAGMDKAGHVAAKNETRKQKEAKKFIE